MSHYPRLGSGLDDFYTRCHNVIDGTVLWSRMSHGHGDLKGGAEKMNARVPAEVFSPGEFIGDELSARGWTQTDLAQIMGRPLRMVNELILGKKQITPETAHDLAKAFGDEDALYWMNLDAARRGTKISH